MRYRTGDFVVLSEDKKCPCGRIYPVIERIEGRVGDYLIGENGQKVHILNHIPKGIDGLLACQFIQNELDYIEVLAVVDEELFSESQAQQLRKNVRERLGQSMNVEIKHVDALPRTRNGKVRQAVCSIKDLSCDK